ncbi:NAD-dependent dehydratase [Polaribacter reichenbachii]|uniref:NAD-dependent dehydratase n=1 Tax=Polaribacter reichenbachii TaxID=996801 RepID=A0A1B8TNM5_9FLAO|nr:SDR family oxidoreductase [Polaribacter reichenbachii]APZ48124.1 NAD-dependent dehydratase [Polaribacter reichenbachii]AUC20391.1 NAD-dependent dehydratase [Polaribacter reichenbachii]OBY61261.1 NAD-dependent dehydratase [Polaribacter reichenbachii]
MKKNNSQTVLLAGATGYLGSFITKALVQGQYKIKLIARSPERLESLESETVKIIKAEVTKPKSLKGICEGVTTVISTVGITRQKDGLTYMDVDYQANLNLLNEAKKAGVKKFIYVSAINGDKYRHLKIFEAKEKFVSELKASGIHYTIVRPNGFFSDMKDFLQMAKSGRVYLFGDGNQKFNPIAGEDLANFIYELLDTNVKEVSVGGPDILSLNDISKMALQTLNKPVKITRLPDGFRKFIIWSLRKFTNVKTYGPIEFFLTLMAKDNIAPKYGKHRLINFYQQNS